MKTTTAYTQPLADGGPSICGSYCHVPGDGLKKTVLRWANDDAKLMNLVRDLDQRGCSHSHPVATTEDPMIVSMEPCGVCLSCRARKLRETKT